MPTPIRFAVAEVADLDLLAVLMQEYYAFERLPFDERRARTALERLIADPSLGRVWLLYEAEEAAGYVVLTLGYSLEYLGRDAFIDELYLRAGYRGRGLGTQAIRFVEDACRKLGVNALHLEVERANEAAQAFYRKAGYADHDRYLMTKGLRT